MKRCAPNPNGRIKTPEYDLIRSLATQLQQNSKVTACREVGKKLLSRVNNVDVRRRLAEEATLKARHARHINQDVSVVAARCFALAQLWKMIISGAINFVERISKGGKSKAKLNAEDIVLPFKLLQACDSPDEAFDNVGICVPKVSKSLVRKLLTYCLAMLADEKVVQMGEVKLLEMLNHLCSRSTHVESFNSKIDLPNILSEIAVRLDFSGDGKTKPATMLEAAKAFETMFATCGSLGIQVHSLLEESLHLVFTYCKRYIKSGEVTLMSDIEGHFYNVVTILLDYHGDHMIGPMERKGRHIMKFARRCFPMAKGWHKYAISKYFLAHM